MNDAGQMGVNKSSFKIHEDGLLPLFVNPSLIGRPPLNLKTMPLVPLRNKGQRESTDGETTNRDGAIRFPPPSADRIGTQKQAQTGTVTTKISDCHFHYCSFSATFHSSHLIYCRSEEYSENGLIFISNVILDCEYP
jgi:hypothetical protein